MIPTDLEFAQLTGLFKSLFGLALGPEKKYLVSLRLEGVLRTHQLKSYQQLLDRCQNSESAELRIEVIDAMTTGETSFFRDTHPFQAIENTIFRDLAERFFISKKTGRDKIRIWSAACSTGQEVYSLAILIQELCERAKAVNPASISFEDFSILATDISSKAIKAARLGQYSQWEIDRGMSDHRKQLYFHQNGSAFQIRPELRRIIDFRQDNILERSSMPTEMDLIMCRNVLIYFDEAHRAQLIEDLAQCLAAGGYLILGAAEITSRFPSSLQQLTIGPSTVYRKRA